MSCFSLNNCGKFLRKYGENNYIFSVPEGMKINEPISLSLKTSGHRTEFSLSIYAGKGSEVTIIQTLNSFVKSSTLALSSQIQVEEGAKVRFISVQNLPVKIKFSETRNVRCGANARINAFDFHFGAQYVKSQVLQQSAGQNAVMNYNLVSRARGSQNFDLNFGNIFSNQHGRGEIIAKSVAEDEAILNMHGAITVKRQGAGTKTNLTQSVLNLSPATKIKATPALKIDTNEVTAGHSAGITNLREDDLFYMASRGLARAEASRIMIHGFLKSELNKLNDLPELQQQIISLL
jgi:Fe-S cluster assembly protein SufD